MPRELYIPILPIKYKINSDDRLVYPLGAFKGYWYSEEMYFLPSKVYVLNLNMP
jgi:hypothetical protein